MRIHIMLALLLSGLPSSIATSLSPFNERLSYSTAYKPGEMAQNKKGVRSLQDLPHGRSYNFGSYQLRLRPEGEYFTFVGYCHFKVSRGSPESFEYDMQVALYPKEQYSDFMQAVNETEYTGTRFTAHSMNNLLFKVFIRVEDKALWDLHLLRRCRRRIQRWGNEHE